MKNVIIQINMIINKNIFISVYLCPFVVKDIRG